MNIRVQGSDQFSSGKAAPTAQAHPNKKSSLFGGTSKKKKRGEEVANIKPDAQSMVVEEKSSTTRTVLSAGDVIPKVVTNEVESDPSAIELKAWDDAEFEGGLNNEQGEGSATPVSDGAAHNMETPSRDEGKSMDGKSEGEGEPPAEDTEGIPTESGSVEEPALPTAVRKKRAHKTRSKRETKSSRGVNNSMATEENIDQLPASEVDDSTPVVIEVFDTPTFLGLTIGFAIAAFALGWILTNQILAKLLGV